MNLLVGFVEPIVGFGVVEIVSTLVIIAIAVGLIVFFVRRSKKR